MSKNPFKIGDIVVVKRALTNEYNGIIAKVTKIIGHDKNICKMDKKDLNGRDLRLEWQKLDLYKEENEI